MPWNYSAVPTNSNTDGSGRRVHVAVKLVKTFFDDSGVEIVTVDTTAEDAIANAEAGFIQEYVDTARAVYREQLEYLLNYQDGVRQEAASSDASLLGFTLRESVETLNQLYKGQQQ